MRSNVGAEGNQKNKESSSAPAPSAASSVSVPPRGSSTSAGALVGGEHQQGTTMRNVNPAPQPDVSVRVGIGDSSGRDSSSSAANANFLLASSSSGQFVPGIGANSSSGGAAAAQSQLLRQLQQHQQGTVDGPQPKRPKLSPPPPQTVAAPYQRLMQQQMQVQNQSQLGTGGAGGPQFNASSLPSAIAAAGGAAATHAHNVESLDASLDDSSGGHNAAGANARQRTGEYSTLGNNEGKAKHFRAYYLCRASETESTSSPNNLLDHRFVLWLPNVIIWLLVRPHPHLTQWNCIVMEPRLLF